jgi:hypothetical protein
MNDFLFWLYLVNAVLLITHEIDSAYQKEWELFRLPGGAAGFLVLHVPLVAVVLYGFYLVIQDTNAGLVISLIVSLAGIFAFGIHTYFIKKRKPEFTAPVSQIILWALLFLSLVQSVTSLYLFGVKPL